MMVGRRTTRARRLLVGLCAAGLAAAPGCASEPGPILRGAPDAPAWPLPPDPARVRFLGELRTDEDLKPGRSGMQRLGRALFGKDPPRAMESPMAVCTDGRSRLFVADSTARLVHVFDLETRRYEQWRPPKQSPPFSLPVGVAYDPAGRLLVCDSAAGTLVCFGADGDYRGVLGQGALSRPCGVAVDRTDGRLLVIDAGAHQLVTLGPDGAERSRLGRRGAGPGEFNFPTGVAQDSRGRVYVSDSLNFRVQVFGPGLEFQRQIGSKGDMPGYFSQPKGIAIDRRDRLLVVDGNFEAVQIFDPDGALLMTFGREGSGPGEFWLPGGIHADAEGRVWVADSFNHRVQAFEDISPEAEP